LGNDKPYDILLDRDILMLQIIGWCVSGEKGLKIEIPDDKKYVLESLKS